MNMTWMEWYNSLWKPSWTPAPATIGLIWQILYPIIILVPDRLGTTTPGMSPHQAISEGHCYRMKLVIGPYVEFVEFQVVLRKVITAHTEKRLG